MGGGGATAMNVSFAESLANLLVCYYKKIYLLVTGFNKEKVLCYILGGKKKKTKRKKKKKKKEGSKEHCDIPCYVTYVISKIDFQPSTVINTNDIYKLGMNANSLLYNNA